MYERKLNEYKECKKQSKTSAENSKWTRLIKSVENQIREHKTHIAQLKKHI